MNESSETLPHAPSDADAALLKLAADIAVLGGSDREMIDRLTLLERLIAACSAAQVRVVAAFAESQHALLTSREVPEADRTRSIAGQVALACREGPARARRRVCLARVLVADMPATVRALQNGDISDWHAREIAARTILLDPVRRRAVDAELAGTLAGLSVAEVRRRATLIAQRLDPEAATIAARHAHAGRCVTIRPAPDGTAYLTAKLPMTVAVAVYAALHGAARTAVAGGEARSRSQLMADLLVSGITSPPRGVPGDAEQAPPGTGLPHGVGVEIQLIMTDRTLLDGAADPALLAGHDSIPAPLARRLLADLDGSAKVWVRRLYTDRGRLTGMDSSRRLFPHAARRFLLARDQVCRTPWCSAPIRHIDHIAPVVDGGRTTVSNGQGLCETCNHTKQTPGWSSCGAADGSVTVTTPTGHSYTSRPALLPGSGERLAELALTG